MDETRFWSLIDRLDWDKQGDDDVVVEPVIAALAAMTEGDIQDFENTLVAKLYALDGRAWARESGSDWWGEPDNLSVDGFLYSRCVVVANGRDFYNRVLADPKQMPKDLEFESLIYVAASAYERKTGGSGDVIRDASPLSYETFSNSSGWTTD